MKRFAYFLTLVIGIALLPGGSDVAAATAFAEGGAFAEGEDDFSLGKKELENLSEELKTVFDFVTAGDLTKEAEAKNALFKQMEAVSEKNGIGSLLKFPNQIYRLKELTIDTKSKDARIFNTKAGQGFQENFFTDFTEGERIYRYFVSIPKGYDAEEDQRFPVLIYLHDKSDTLDKRRMMKAMKEEVREAFSDDTLLDKFIIIAPVGPEDGKKNLLDPAENWETLDPGRKSAFIAIRILLEKMVFDRGKVFVMGFGRNGLSAIRFVTWYPSLFSGAVAVDAPLEPLFMENAAGLQIVYVDSQANDSKRSEAAASWAQGFSGEDGPIVKVVKEAAAPAKGSRLAAEGIAALHEFNDIASRNTAPARVLLKSINLEFSTNCWVQVQVMNNTATMKVGDEDVPFVDARVDRDSNTFDIKTNRVGRVRIFLNDKLVDMDREIKVNLNGAERWNGTKERNGVLMLRMLYENWAGDYEVYTNYIDIEDEGA